MKNVVKLQHYCFPRERKQEIGRFIEYCNHVQYHESLNNVKPVDVYAGRNRQILDSREKITRRTLQMRRWLNLGNTNCVSKFLPQVAHIALTTHTGREIIFTKKY